MLCPFCLILLPVSLEAGRGALQMLNEVGAAGIRARGVPRNRLRSPLLVLMGKQAQRAGPEWESFSGVALLASWQPRARLPSSVPKPQDLPQPVELGGADISGDTDGAGLPDL